MSRPIPPSIETTEVYSPCGKLFDAKNAEEAGNATLSAAAEYGAVGAHLHLEGPSPSSKPVRLSWAREGRELEPELAQLMEAFLEHARQGRVSVRRSTEDDPRHWISLPVNGPEQFHGNLVVASLDPPDEPHLFALAGVLGCKLDHLRSELEVGKERERNAGWFKTMDAQIRVLEQERQKFAALVNKTDAAIFVAGPEGRILWTNPVLARRYGNTRGNLVGSECRDLCGQDEECEDCPVKMVRNGNHLVHLERQETRNDEVRNLYVSAFPVRSPEGDINEVLVMLQDITDLETLRRSEERYQLLFERSTDAILMAHPESMEIVMANRQAKKLLALRAEGRTPTLLDLHPENVREEMEHHYRNLALGRSLENIEVAVHARNEGALTVNACGTLFDLHGNPVILVEFRDVTHLRQLQTELARADHLITLGTMNAGIAHEFKNRLAPLRAFAQLISMDRGDLSKVLSHAPIMIQEIDRLTALVRDVLDYARPQEPKLATRDFVLSIAMLAEEFEKEFQSVLEETGTRVEVELPEEEVLVDMDLSQIRRAFLNLFKNSIEAMSPERHGQTVRIGVGTDKRGAVLVMEDTGKGMDAQALERIFDPFYTTKGTKGTGLGMCITRSLIEANGGTIAVSSGPGKGTRIEMRFPRSSVSKTLRFQETESRRVFSNREENAA